MPLTHKTPAKPIDKYMPRIIVWHPALATENLTITLAMDEQQVSEIAVVSEWTDGVVYHLDPEGSIEVAPANLILQETYLKPTT